MPSYSTSYDVLLIVDLQIYDLIEQIGIRFYKDSIT